MKFNSYILDYQDANKDIDTSIQTLFKKLYKLNPDEAKRFLKVHHRKPSKIEVNLDGLPDGTKQLLIHNLVFYIQELKNK